MKIVLATPLYPPDIAEPAPYAKELAHRLKDGHQVTIVTYGRLPEPVPGVHIVAVDKRKPLLVRLSAYLRALRRAARHADIVYAQNGPSVEFPLLFVRSRKIFHLADVRAHEYASGHFFRRILERLAMYKARVISDMPPQKPEILPFVPRPDEALAAWEKEWQAHLTVLNETFHVR